MTSFRFRLISLAASWTIMFSGCGTNSPGNTTLAYWNRLLQCSTMASNAQGDARTRTIADLHVRADAIERLPTSGVDPEASSLGLEVARLLREQAVLAEHGNGLAIAQFVDGFTYGLTGEGNPFESTQTYSADIASWGTRYQAWRDSAQTTRVRMTSKYGTEFPSLMRGHAASYQSNGAMPVAADQPETPRSWFKTALWIGLVIYGAAKLFGGKKVVAK